MRYKQSILQKRFSPKQREIDPSGFTLLELLLSLTILAIIITIILAGFKIGIRAWEKGEKNVAERQTYRNTLGLIQQQLASAWNPGVESNIRGWVFEGERKRLEFISKVSLIPGNQNLPVKVNYRVVAKNDGTESLSFMEVPWRPNTERKDSVFQNSYIELLPESAEIEFQYLNESNQDKESSEIKAQLKPLFNWDFESKEVFPIAIRIGFRPESDSNFIYLIIPLRL